MPRKDVDLSEEHIKQLDRVRADRRVSYSDLVKAALDEYFSPKTPGLPDELADRLDGTRSALEQIQQRLWSLDSTNQKSTERLAALEDIAQQSMELLILIGERLSPARGGAPEPTPETPESRESPEPSPEPIQEPYKPHYLSGEELRNQPMYTDPTSKWYIPPQKVEEKRGWFGRRRA